MHLLQKFQQNYCFILLVSAGGTDAVRSYVLVGANAGLNPSIATLFQSPVYKANLKEICKTAFYLPVFIYISGQINCFYFGISYLFIEFTQSCLT